MSAAVASIDVRVFDEILAWQVVVAWVGEGLCDPPRLARWRIDLVDPEGGGDLFTRLLSRTAPWAALEAVRAAAVRVDRGARLRLAQPDTVRTLFTWGFTVDEKLAERLAHHKRSLARPSQALPLPLDLDTPLSCDAFERALKIDGLRVNAVPGGRQVVLNADAGRVIVSVEAKKPAVHEVVIRQHNQVLAVPAHILARHLAAALVQMAPHYPLPYVRVEAA